MVGKTTRNKLSPTALYIGILVLFTLLHAFILYPNSDEGRHGSHIWNTMQLARPFYNDDFAVQWPFQKFSTVLFALMLRYVFPFSFQPLGFIYSALIIVNTFLVFVISRKYVRKQVALLASSVFLFYTLTHDWLSPTRYELWLLPVILSVFLLCERFASTQRVSYLLGSALVIGLVGLPIHSNASILYVYFILFLICHRRMITKRCFLITILLLTLSSVLGMGILLYPDPAGFFRFMKYQARIGDRFAFLINELKRLWFFLTFRFYAHMSLLLGIIILWRWASKRFSRAGWQDAYRAHKGLILYFASVVIALGLLPAGKWSFYVVYYFLPFSVLAAAQFYEFKPTGRSKYAIPLIVAAGTIAGLIKHVQTAGRMSSYEALSFVFLALPVVAVSIFRVLGKIESIYWALILGIVFKLFVSYCNHAIYSVTGELVASRAGGTLVGDLVFYWMAGNNDFVNLHNPATLETDDFGMAVIGPGDRARFEDLMQERACQCQEVARVRSKVDPLFIRADLRDLSVYEFRCGEDLARAENRRISLPWHCVANR